MRTIMKMLTVLSGGGVVFPSQLLTLQQRLDADDLSTLFQDSAMTTPADEDGDVVGAWVDKSSNNYDATQVTTSKKPTLRLTQINGKPAVDPDGGDSLAISMTIAASSYTFYCVVDLVAGDLNADAHYLFDTEPGTRLTIGFIATAGADQNKWAWNDGAWHALGAAQTPGKQIVVIRLESGGNGEIWVNGVSLGTAAYTARAIGGNVALLSHNGGAAAFFNSPVGEWMIYTGAHTNAERTLMQNYLSAKWGITL